MQELQPFLLPPSSPLSGIGGSPVTHEFGSPFLYELVGTWGQVLFPLAWREFRFWYDMRRHNASRSPAVEGFASTEWFYSQVRGQARG